MCIYKHDVVTALTGAADHNPNNFPQRRYVSDEDLRRNVDRKVTVAASYFKNTQKNHRSARSQNPSVQWRRGKGVVLSSCHLHSAPHCGLSDVLRGFLWDRRSWSQALGPPLGLHWVPERPLGRLSWGPRERGRTLRVSLFKPLSDMKCITLLSTSSC